MSLLDMVYDLYLANLYISLAEVSCTLKLLDFLELLFHSKNQGTLLSIIIFLYINVNHIYFFHLLCNVKDYFDTIKK